MAFSDIIARLAVSLSMDTVAFEKGATLAEKRMEQSRRRLEATGKKMAGIGKTMSIAITAPLVALGVTSAKAAAESRDALAQVTSALKSMGPVAGKTEEDLKKLGKQLQYMSTFDDDEILRKVTANLLTFGNISGDVFDRSQRAIVDMATRLKMDLQPATILVGKALNDPKNGLAALGRTGAVSKEWVKDNKKLIEGLVDTGRTAEAQTIVLKALEKQYEGSAKAARDAVPGSDLINKWNDFKETVGEVLLEAFERIEPTLNRIADAFLNISPGMQTTIIAALAIAAALGPLLFIFGSMVTLTAPLVAFIQTLAALAFAQGTLAGATTVLSAGFGSLAASLAPILIPLAAVAAAGYLIYKNWDQISPVLQELWDTVQATIGPSFTKLVDSLRVALTELWDGPFGEGLRGVGRLLMGFGEVAASVLGFTIVSAVKIAAGVITAAFEVIALAVRALTALFDGTLAIGIAGAVAAMVRGVTHWLKDKLGAVFDWVREKVKAVADTFLWLYDAVVGHSYIPDMVDGIAAQMGRLDAVMVAPVAKATKKTTEAFRKAQEAIRDMAQETQALLDRLFPEVRQLLDYRKDLATISASGMSAEQQAEARRRAGIAFSAASGTDRKRPAFLNGADAITLTPQQQTRVEMDWAGALKKLESKTGETTVRIAKSFEDMVEETLGAFSRLTSAIKSGGFLGILEAVVGFGLQLGSVGAFGSKIAANINRSVPGFAGGTNFAPGGLAMVGERGPELVNLPRGSKVYPNGSGPGRGGNTYHFSGNLMTPEFWGMIQQGDMQAADAGAAGGMARMRYSGSRRWR